MKKTIVAALIAAVTVGTVAGGIASFSASQEDTQLQISDSAQSSQSETQPVQDAEAEDKEQKSFTEAISLPSGNIAKTDIADVSEEEMINSGVADVAENVMPAMVSITNTTVQEVNSWFRGGSMQYESRSAGSGVIMGENDDELLIVTNNHVVEDSTELAVTFINETSVNGQLKGTDADNDLAVVAVKLSDIDEETMNQIRIANVADSKDLRVGEQVIAIGNSLGYGQSVTTGIVSALGRTVRVRDTYGISDYEELIQTDTAINAGNSGGALLNLKGEVVGINSIKASANGVEGMGYAIPTSKAVPIIQELMNKVTREKVSDEDAPYIGITGQDVTKSVSELYGLSMGIFLTEVESGSPASDAGMTEGMVLTEFDGNEITCMADLQKILNYYAAGETVSVKVETRNESGETEQKELSLVLGRRSDYVRDVN